MSESAAEAPNDLTDFRARYATVNSAWQGADSRTQLTQRGTRAEETQPGPADSVEDRYTRFVERLAEGMWAQGDWDTWANKPDIQKNLWRIKARRAFPAAAFASITGPTLTAELERLRAEVTLLRGNGGDSDGHNAYVAVLRLRRDQARDDLDRARIKNSRLQAASTDAHDALTAAQTLHETSRNALTRVQELHQQWAGDNGWSDMETGNKPWEAGYKTCWIDRDNELAAALTPPQDNERLTP